MKGNAPKLLPWLARKAGISEARAEELWAEAIRYATEQTGWVGTAEYWRVAMARWLDLIEAESAEPGRLPALVRVQTRMWMLPMIAWHGTTIVLARAWGRLMMHRQLTI